MTWDVKNAHRHSFANESAIVQSGHCGCFFCEATFASSEVAHWLDDKGGRTALCPSCGIDSVLGDRSGLPVTDAAFLVAMRDYWFAGPASASAVFGDAL
jgi:hypothetical protein